jgi:hypothetical protein
MMRSIEERGRISEQKLSRRRAIRAKNREANHTARIQRKLERSCFWTYPFGHEWEFLKDDGGGLHYPLIQRCVLCNKLKNVFQDWAGG